MFAVSSRVLKLPICHGSLGLGTAFKESAAVLHAIHSFIQESCLSVQLIWIQNKNTHLLFGCFVIYYITECHSLSLLKIPLQSDLDFQSEFLRFSVLSNGCILHYSHNILIFYLTILFRIMQSLENGRKKMCFVQSVDFYTV